ncbi:hypothetical protein K0U83_15580 [bacterium]|nr:hypothetical protein [bacterium]
MGFSNTNNLERVRHYEEAHRYFTQTAKPRRKGWSDNERPLGTAAQHHYRIEKSNAAYADYYDVILYSTTMARFYAPNSAGETRICYNGDSRVTSTQFMWQVLHVGAFYQLRDTENVLRYVPIGSQRSFSTDLWFNKEGQLLVKCSTHAPIVSLHASKSLSEWKAQLKRKLDPVICLMEIAVQETLDAGDGSNEWNAGRAFRSLPTSSDVDHQMRRWVEAGCPALNEKGYETMRELYITCAEFIIDRRLIKAAPKQWGNRGSVTPYTTPKPAVVTTSVLNYLAKFAPYSVKASETRPLPQFPTELPSSWRFV